MGRVPKKRFLCQYERNVTKQYVALKFLGFWHFYCWVFKIPISASVLPVFWAFPVLGPIITSLAIAREAIMMGPRTGNAQKTGKTRRKWVFFNSTIEIVRNLKISMLQLAIVVCLLFVQTYWMVLQTIFFHFRIHWFNCGIQYQIANCWSEQCILSISGCL